MSDSRICRSDLTLWAVHPQAVEGPPAAGPDRPHVILAAWPAPAGRPEVFAACRPARRSAIDVRRRRLLSAFVVLGAILLADVPASLVVLHISRLRVERATLRAQAAQEPYRDTEWGTAYWREITRYSELSLIHI